VLSFPDSGPSVRLAPALGGSYPNRDLEVPPTESGTGFSPKPAGNGFEAEGVRSFVSWRLGGEIRSGLGDLGVLAVHTLRFVRLRVLATLAFLAVHSLRFVRLRVLATLAFLAVFISGGLNDQEGFAHSCGGS
jgi:hypothetical protein